VAITQSAVEDASPPMIARTLPPTLPIMEAGLAVKQRIMAERDLPLWNRTDSTAGVSQGGTLTPGTGGSQAQNAILQSLQVLLLQAQTQGTIPPSVAPKRVKKPSEHWEGTIDLLLRLAGVDAEADLPPVWGAWANCNKKEARMVLQEHLRTNASALNLPEPVASGDLTTMRMTMSFKAMYEDDLEAGLQPFAVSYKDQQTIAHQQQVNQTYDLVQQGAAPQLQDLYALKEASKISVPTTEQQMIRTLKAFTVLLYTVVGPSNPLYRAFKHELIDPYDSFQPVVETYVASLPGQPIYTQMVRWAQLRCNAYWEAVVRSTTGTVRAPEFGALYSDIQYKQWNRPAIPRKYLATPKTTSGGNASGGATGDTAGRAAVAKKKVVTTPEAEAPDRLRNPAFKEELRALGLKIGKVSSFLVKAAPAGKEKAAPPSMESGTTFCLNWHTKGHCWSHCAHQQSHAAPTDTDVQTLTSWIEQGLARME
jgi:hypothetical protein